MGLGPTDDHGRHNNRASGRWRQSEWSRKDEFSGIT